MIHTTRPRRGFVITLALLLTAFLVAALPAIYAQQPERLEEPKTSAAAGARGTGATKLALNEVPSRKSPGAAVLPGRSKVIVALDIGHSLPSPGCISAFGRTEYAYNKDVVERIAAKLSQSATVTPYVVNPSGQAISLRLRTELARKHGAELFLSVHHDAAQPQYLKSWMVDGKKQSYSEDFRGYGVFVSERNPFPAASRTFGTLLGQEMRRAGFPFSPHHNEPIKGENRAILDQESGLYRYDDLIVLWSARMPAALLECGVIIHPEEAKVLAQPETREKIAGAVAAAVEKLVADRPHTPWR